MNSIGKYADKRIERYVNSAISNLPLFLVEPELSGINSGMMIMQCNNLLIKIHQQD